jgi:hypothetical protein
LTFFGKISIQQQTSNKDANQHEVFQTWSSSGQGGAPSFWYDAKEHSGWEICSSTTVELVDELNSFQRHVVAKRRPIEKAASGVQEL